MTVKTPFGLAQLVFSLGSSGAGSGLARLEYSLMKVGLDLSLSMCATSNVYIELDHGSFIDRVENIT